MGPHMQTILAIDPAWTTKEPSGIALVAGIGNRWECFALAPSYAAFYDLAGGKSVDWGNGLHQGAEPEPDRLLNVAKELSPTGRVDLIAIDMPLALTPFSSRREADNAVSREYGGRKCGTHTPNEFRPGPLSQIFSGDFGMAGFPLATTTTVSASYPALLEVYPHPALLHLMEEKERLCYKTGKTRTYWPAKSVEERRTSLSHVLAKITESLSLSISNIPMVIPAPQDIESFAALKPYEDALDPLSRLGSASAILTVKPALMATKTPPFGFRPELSCDH